MDINVNITKKFTDLAGDIYHEGMLRYEMICENLMMYNSNFKLLTEEEKSKFQEILDYAQCLFEEEF